MPDVTSIRASAGMWLNNRLPTAMHALGVRCAGMVTQELDTPYPPASSPGESPHKRTGNLQAGVDHRERVEGTDSLTEISSKRAPSGGDDHPSIHEHHMAVINQSMVPVWLEFGTHKMAARPYMRPVMNAAEQIVPHSMSQSLSSGETYAAAG